MVGLDRVKVQFNTLINRARLNEQRREYGDPVPDSTMHLVFTGQPGTGKSTAARLLAQAYHAIGLVKKPTVKEISGRDLVSEFQAGSAKQVKEIFDEARGGVLFVDEAYSMVNGDQDIPGKEALNEFLKLAEDRRGDTVVILAGYSEDDNSEDVVRYLNQYNHGMSSRFPTRVPFDLYNAQELAQIGERELSDINIKFSDDKARKTFKMAAARAGGDAENPSNARGVRSLVGLILNEQANRLAREQVEFGRRVTPKDWRQVTSEDIKAGLDGLMS